MTKTEIDSVKAAIHLLQNLLPDQEQRGTDPEPNNCPVRAFAKHYLQQDPAWAMSCHELGGIYDELAKLGKVDPLARSVFYRELPGAMAEVFGLRKSHSLVRHGKVETVRGFRKISLREEAL